MTDKTPDSPARRPSLMQRISRRFSNRSSSSRPNLTTLRAQSVRMFNPDKKKNTVFRWNLLWTILVLGGVGCLGLAPIWMKYAGLDCDMIWVITASLFTGVDAVFIFAALLTWPCLISEIVTYLLTPYDLRQPTEPEVTPDGQPINPYAKGATIDEDTGLPKVTHLVVMVGYKEPVDLICKTVDTLAMQTLAKSMIMVIGLEERTPDYESKMEYFQHRYSDSFFRLIITIHPYGLTGELPGTCSNVNWAIRQSTTQMRDEGFPLHPRKTIVSKMDTDVIYMPMHFEILERTFLKLDEETRCTATFQSPLIYNLALDERWFFTRVTGILRTFFMTGFLIPYSINTMSNYSLSLYLARKAGYWIPNYQMEDIIQNLNFMAGIGKRVPIYLLPVPVVSGPTSGPTLWIEFQEWWLQARRWAYGAAEVFHYFMVKFINNKFDKCSGIGYGVSFILYYGFILCVAGLYQLCVAITVIFDTCPNESFLQKYWFAILLGIKYCFVFGTAYFADWLHRKIAGIREPALEGFYGWIRSIFHFLSTIFVLLTYNICEACAILELTYKGRDMCGHTPSKKGALVGAEIETFDDDESPLKKNKKNNGAVLTQESQPESPKPGSILRRPSAQHNFSSLKASSHRASSHDDRLNNYYGSNHSRVTFQDELEHMENGSISSHSESESEHVPVGKGTGKKRLLGKPVLSMSSDDDTQSILESLPDILRKNSEAQKDSNGESTSSKVSFAMDLEDPLPAMESSFDEDTNSVSKDTATSKEDEPELAKPIKQKIPVRDAETLASERKPAATKSAIKKKTSFREEEEEIPSTNHFQETFNGEEDDDGQTFFSAGTSPEQVPAENSNSLFQSLGEKSYSVLRSIMARLASEEAAVQQQQQQSSSADFLQQLAGFGAPAPAVQQIRGGKANNNDVKVTYRELAVETGNSREVTIEAKVNYRSVNPPRKGAFSSLPPIV